METKRWAASSSNLFLITTNETVKNTNIPLVHWIYVVCDIGNQRLIQCSINKWWVNEIASVEIESMHDLNTHGPCLLHDSFHIISIDIQLYTIYNRYLCKVFSNEWKEKTTCMSIMLIICLYISLSSDFFVFKLSGIFTVHALFRYSLVCWPHRPHCDLSLQFKWNCVAFLFTKYSQP